MENFRKYKLKTSQCTFQPIVDEEGLTQAKLDQVFDFIFSKTELALLQSLSYDDNMIGDKK